MSRPINHQNGVSHHLSIPCLTWYRNCQTQPSRITHLMLCWGNCKCHNRVYGVTTVWKSCQHVVTTLVHQNKNKRLPWTSQYIQIIKLSWNNSRRPTYSTGHQSPTNPRGSWWNTLPNITSMIHKQHNKIIEDWLHQSTVITTGAYHQPQI